jgi:hypothetical protein
MKYDYQAKFWLTLINVVKIIKIVKSKLFYIFGNVMMRHKKCNPE